MTGLRVGIEMARESCLKGVAFILGAGPDAESDRPRQAGQHTDADKKGMRGQPLDHANQNASAGRAISTSAPVFSLARWAAASGRMRSTK